MTKKELVERLNLYPDGTEVLLKSNVPNVRWDPEYHTTEYVDMKQGKILIVGDTLMDSDPIYKYEEEEEEEIDASDEQDGERPGKGN